VVPRRIVGPDIRTAVQRGVARTPPRKVPDISKLHAIASSYFVPVHHWQLCDTH
jgi:hypothetical protein